VFWYGVALCRRRCGGGRRDGEKSLKSGFGSGLCKGDVEGVVFGANVPASRVAEVNKYPPKRGLGAWEGLEFDLFERPLRDGIAALEGADVCFSQVDHKAGGLLKREGCITKGFFALKNQGRFFRTRERSKIDAG